MADSDILHFKKTRLLCHYVPRNDQAFESSAGSDHKYKITLTFPLSLKGEGKINQGEEIIGTALF